jgi:DNA polymerase-3 subunit delta'
MNWNIIGHDWAVQFLRRGIERGLVSHAYIISGPAGVGKRLLALRLAQALNCERGEPDPCGECRACRRIERGNHPDVRVAGLDTQAAVLGLKEEQAEKQRALRVELVRSFQGDIALRPYEARRRVLILHDAERLNDQASNALLKTLEEPPPHATLILVANSGGSLLPTITSRCQMLRLRPAPRALVAQALAERLNVVPEDAALLAAWSGGRVGWAMHLASSPEELEARQAQLDALVQLPGQPRAAAFKWAEERAKEFRGGGQQATFDILELWQSWWRDVLLCAAGFPDALTHLDRRDTLGEAARRFPLDAVRAFIARIDEAATRLRENVSPQLVFESLLLHVPR